MLKYCRILFFLCIACFYSQYSFAQRAEGTIERNEDVKLINGLYNQGKWEEGKAEAEAILKKNPKDPDVRMMLGKYYLHKKQYDKARYELVKSLEYAPANVDAKHMLVTVETDTKRYSSAICYINELLEVNPYWKGLWREKIELYRIMGNHVEADRLLKRISQIYPEDNDFKKDQAYVLEQREIAVKKAGRIDEVLEIAKKRVDIQPKQQDSYLSVVDNYIKAGDYNNALVYTERGLNELPGNSTLVQKKIAILEHQKRFPEILAFMEAQMKAGGGALRTQYNYFLLEAARSAKNNDPAGLYGKIFDSSPSNKEAFDYVFKDLIAKEQYEEAIASINKHRRSVGTNRDLDMKELMAYKRLGDNAKVMSLTRSFFLKYPGDEDLKTSYIEMLLVQAKNNIEDGKTGLAIRDWREVIQYGDTESIAIAQRGLYNTYVNGGRFQDAILVLDDMLLDQPGDVDLMLKKSDLYNKEGRYEYALNLYEQVLGSVSEQDRDRLMSGYSEMIQSRVKSLRENYRLTEARDLCDRWLTMDDRNQEALLYMINICFQIKDNAGMLRYAQIADERYGDDIGFKIKLAEAMNHNPEKRPDSWQMLLGQVQLNPYHDPLLNTFVFTTEEYAGQLLKQKEYSTALNVLDSALHYKDNKELKYMKGIAYEGLKNFDSAYVYQQFNEPTLLELADFKNHLDYLLHKSYRNNFGFSHLRGRYGDDYSITTISSMEYTHLKLDGSSYTGRLNYAGRNEGKGIQGQFEWINPWTEKLSTKFDIALSNKYFAKIAVNVGATYVFKPTWEAEAALGFRNFYDKKNIINLNVGAAKTFDDLKLSMKLSNFVLDNQGQRIFLYSVAARAQYFMKNPKNYLLAVGSVGSSPDVDVLNNNFYNSFNVFNAMVGGGVGRSLGKNIGASVLGTWYNFQSDQSVVNTVYKNFYNLYFQLNVSF